MVDCSPGWGLTPSVRGVIASALGVRRNYPERTLSQTKMGSQVLLLNLYFDTVSF